MPDIEKQGVSINHVGVGTTQAVCRNLNRAGAFDGGMTSTAALAALAHLTNKPVNSTSRRVIESSAPSDGMLLQGIMARAGLTPTGTANLRIWAGHEVKPPQISTRRHPEWLFTRIADVTMTATAVTISTASDYSGAIENASGVSVDHIATSCSFAITTDYSLGGTTKVCGEAAEGQGLYFDKHGGSIIVVDAEMAAANGSIHLLPKDM